MHELIKPHNEAFLNSIKLGKDILMKSENLYVKGIIRALNTHPLFHGKKMRSQMTPGSQ